MIKFSKILIKSCKNGQNDLNTLIDNDCYEEYKTLNQELIIDIEFGNTVVENIQLKISPCPENDIQYKLFNLSEQDKECNIQKGKLIKERLDDLYAIYTSFGHKQLVFKIFQKPFQHLQLSIRSEKFQSFKVYFIGLKGKRILDQAEILKQQQEEAKQQVVKTPKSIYKPARIDTQPQIGVPSDLSFQDFISKVKAGQRVVPISPDEKLTKDRIDVEEKPEQPTNYITLVIEDDNENSVQFIGNKSVQQKKFGLNLEKPFKSLFTNSDQKQQNITKYFNKNTSSKQDPSDGWLKFDIGEIDQGFVQVHKQLEISKGLPRKFRLTNRMYNEL